YMNNKRLFFISLVSTLGAVCVSCPASSATVLARVNNHVITLEEFNKKYEQSLKFFQFRAPSRKAFLDDLIKREVGVEEAHRLNVQRDPAVVDQMNTVLYNALLDKELGKKLAAIAVSD